MVQRIEINKTSSVPVYKQIYDWIVQRIFEGDLRKDDKLPTERELSEQLSVSRGTVKKAYLDLIYTGFAFAKRGSGTYVVDINKSSDIELVSENLCRVIDNIIDLGCSKNEIDILYTLCFEKKRGNHDLVNVAIVDCNFEAMKTIEKRFSHINTIKVMSMLLSEVDKFRYPNFIFKNFDVVITTKTHYSILSHKIPEHKHKIVKVALSPDKKTTVEIAGLQKSGHVGIITKSRRFSNIINYALDALDLRLAKETALFSDFSTEDEMINFVKDKNVLILPPNYAVDNHLSSDVILSFVRQGGSIIAFRYTIEDGSVIYVEDRVKETLLERIST